MVGACWFDSDVLFDFVFTRHTFFSKDFVCGSEENLTGGVVEYVGVCADTGVDWFVAAFMDSTIV
jgi:hypothetical protein